MTKTSPAQATPAAAVHPVTADVILDITAQVCPMTFVHTRLALERMPVGSILLVLMRGEEPSKNVPASARALGHQVLDQFVDEAGVTRVLLRRQ
jgi:TusA-related sulfurtransferase